MKNGLFALRCLLIASMFGCGDSEEKMFEVTSMALYQPDEVLAQRLSSVDTLAAYLETIQKQAHQFWSERPECGPGVGAIVIAIKPGGKSRFWLVYNSKLRTQLQEELNRTLGKVRPPDVKNGSVAVAINFAIGGAKPVATDTTTSSPPMPEEWTEAARTSGKSLSVPDGILEIVWKED